MRLTLFIAFLFAAWNLNAQGWIGFEGDESDYQYQEQIETAVCSDTLCQILSCVMYWDITGRYVGLYVDPNQPFTKFDHKPFSPEDYQRLHKLLSDRHSILDQRTKQEWIDETRKLESKKYDAVSGATQIELKNVTVPGALYSSYTLWDLAQGKLSERYAKESRKSLTRDDLPSLLNSHQAHIQLFGLELLEPSGYRDNLEKINQILMKGPPINRQFIIQNAPNWFYQEQEQLGTMIDVFTHFDTRSITFFLTRLEQSPKLPKKLKSKLKDSAPALSKNQQKILSRITDPGPSPG